MPATLVLRPTTPPLVPPNSKNRVPRKRMSRWTLRTPRTRTPKPVIIDSRTFPHIIDRILDHVYHTDPVQYHSLQVVCPKWRRIIKKRLFSHVCLTSAPSFRAEGYHEAYNISTIPPSLELHDVPIFERPEGYPVSLLKRPPVLFITWATAVDFVGTFSDDFMAYIAKLAVNLTTVRIIAPTVDKYRKLPFPPSVSLVFKSSNTSGYGQWFFGRALENDFEEKERRELMVINKVNMGDRVEGWFLATLRQCRPLPKHLVILYFTRRNIDRYSADLCDVLMECKPWADPRFTLTLVHNNREPLDQARSFLWNFGVSPSTIEQYLRNIRILTHVQFRAAVGEKKYRLYIMH